MKLRAASPALFSWSPASPVLLGAAATALLLSTWLFPTEGAAGGLTTWRAILWMGLAVATSLAWKGPAPRWTLLDGSIGLVILGQVAGGLLVLWGEGQRRTAANLLVEWLGLAAAWWVCRQIVSTPGWRQAAGRPLLALAIAVAAFGIWQHSVELPRMAAELAPQIARIRTGDTAPDLVARLNAAGVPLSEPGLTLFEKRLVDSREPFGMFALANTLGGLLAAFLVWLIAGWAERAPANHNREAVGSRWRLRLWLLVMSGLLAGCLVLTKSRTALIGLFAGLALVMLRWNLTTGTAAGRAGVRRAVTTVLVLVVAGVALAPLLLASGVWDPQVLQEAPKSLLYRWQYWVGSGRLLAESPWLGVGLGQFRNAYLRVKLPAASEEIADPHNLWLDAAVNGGVLSLLGLLLGLYWLSRHLLQTLSFRSATEGETANATGISTNIASKADVSQRSATLWGGVAAFLLSFGVELWAGNWDDRLLVLAALWGAIVWSGRWFPAPLARLSTAAPPLFAAVCLLVHLLGAGGFEMPAVMTWVGLWLLWSQAANTVPSPVAATAVNWKFAEVGIVTATTILSGTMLWWPDVRCREQTELAHQHLRAGRVDSAVRTLEQAAALDRWSPEPWRQLSELQLRRWEGLTDRNSAAAMAVFFSAQTALEGAIARDPANPHLRDRLGDLQTTLAETSGAPADFYMAWQTREQAATTYPTNVQFGLKLARVARQAEESARAQEVATRTLQQDQINRDCGHLERWLSDKELAELRQLAGVTGSAP